MKRLWLVATVCVGVVLLALAQTQQSSPTSQTFLLRYKGKPGDVSRYKSWFVMRMVGTMPTPAGLRDRCAH